jgi:hypothetical protein
MYKIGNWFLLETGANYQIRNGEFPINSETGTEPKSTQKVLIAPQKLKRNGVGFETGATK